MMNQIFSCDEVNVVFFVVYYGNGSQLVFGNELYYIVEVIVDVDEWLVQIQLVVIYGFFCIIIEDFIF